MAIRKLSPITKHRLGIENGRLVLWLVVVVEHCGIFTDVSFVPMGADFVYYALGYVDRAVRAVKAPYGPMGACGDLWRPLGTYRDI